MMPQVSHRKTNVLSDTLHLDAVHSKPLKPPEYTGHKRVVQKKKPHEICPLAEVKCHLERMKLHIHRLGVVGLVFMFEW